MFRLFYLRLQGRLRREQGFTIVEMMVVVALIGFLSAISVSLISLLFQSNIRAAQSANQQNNIEVFYGFLASKLSYVQRSQVGVPTTGNEVMAKSLSSDQMLFTFEDDLSGVSTCYRLMYVRDAQEIRVASINEPCNSPDNPLIPKRGPNESFSGAKTADGFAIPEENPLFDPALDSASDKWDDWVGGVLNGKKAAGINSFVIASGVRDGSGYRANAGQGETPWPPSFPEKYKNPQAPEYTEYASGAISVFSYFADGSPLPPPSEGGVDISGLNSVRVKSFSSAASSINENAILPDRFYEQRFFIDQLCPVIPDSPANGDPGAAPPTLDNLPKSPGVSLRFSGGQAGSAVSFQAPTESPFFQNKIGQESFWESTAAEEIVVPRSGIYTLSANVCFPNNSQGAFEVGPSDRSGDPFLVGGGQFSASLPEGSRCLSASRTLLLQENERISLFPEALQANGDPAEGDLSLIWESLG